MKEARIRAFRTLKPPCVDLYQVILRYKSKKATVKEIIKSLQGLLEILVAVSGQQNALDPKLAEYAFMPLSHIFRDARDLPVRVVELALQCLQILIAHGWREQLSSDLGKQLLILLCFLAGGSATDAKVKDVNEELATAALECLATLLEASKGRFLGGKSIDSENIPILGHAVTVMLDGITDGPSVKVRLTALNALDKMIDGITDHEALKSIFPGVVSSLTKILSSKKGTRPSVKIITVSLKILANIICQVIGDDQLSKHDTARRDDVTDVKDGELGTDAWTRATAGQVKMALSNILPLRYHERTEVRVALIELCRCVVTRCRDSLSQSVPMLTETMVVLYSQAPKVETLEGIKLDQLLAQDAGLLEIVKSSLHDWVVALPRVMQSNDDARKGRTMEQIYTAFKMLQGQDIGLDVLYHSMTISLRASVSTAIQARSKAVNAVSESSLEVTQLLQNQNITSSSTSTSFSPVLLSESSNKVTMTGLQKLAAQLKDLPMSTDLQQGIIGTLRNTSGDEQLAGLWLSLQLLDDVNLNDSFMNQYLDLPQDIDSQQPFLDEVYAFSLDILATSTFEDEERWKLQCLALEVVAMQARHQGYDFRPELVDALYPMLERLGSNNATLQQHAMTCLNLVSSTCEYPDAAALVIDNADYLVNAVALKLNTFDISPQAPQVLVMMIKLSGSALIPYLDDLVDSIFSILACYHGYPKLVESLFSVLNAIVEEAAKSSAYTIKPRADTTSKPQPYQPLSIPSLASLLRSNRESRSRPLSPSTSPPPEPTTTSPPNNPSETEDKPLSKTHTLLHNIALLCPYHLPTPSPPLRSSILTLLTTLLPLLSHDSTTFLPLTATLYPSLLPRLHDPEPYVTLAAANAIRTLCECAGDFLTGRIEDDWLKFVKLYERVEGDMREEVRVMGRGSGKRGMRWRVWDGVVRLLVAIVGDVGVNGGMEDGVFGLLEGIVGEREDVREVLRELNSDALWVVEMRGRGGELVRPEGVEGAEFRDFRL